jgi:hypothetical protein
MRKLVRIVLTILIGINILYVFSGVVRFPVRSMDVLSDWFLKAKVLYMDSQFPQPFFYDWEYQAAHMQYPLLLPYAIATVYKVYGQISEVIPLVAYPFIYAILLCVAYHSLKFLVQDSTVALGFTYVYSMLSPLLAQGGRGHAGNADILIALFGWITIFLVFAMIKSKRLGVLLSLWVICVGVASQIKLEGAFLIATLFFLPLPVKKKIPAISLAILPALIWMQYVQNMGFASDIVYKIPSITVILQRIGTIIVGITNEFSNFRNWYILWPLTLLGLYLKLPVHAYVRKLLPALAIMGTAYIGAYVFSFFARTEIDTYRYISSSIDRILLQLSPIIFLFFTDMFVKIFAQQFSWPSKSHIISSETSSKRAR